MLLFITRLYNVPKILTWLTTITRLYNVPKILTWLTTITITRLFNVPKSQWCEYAAKHGYLEVLKWARENGAPCDEWTCWNAQQNMVIWIFFNGQFGMVHPGIN